MMAMYEAGYGTGHVLDLRPTQVDIDATVHNVLQQVTEAGSIVGATEPAPLTMCGLQLEKSGALVGVPFNAGPTTCDQCAILAAWVVVATRHQFAFHAVVTRDRDQVRVGRETPDGPWPRQ